MRRRRCNRNVFRGNPPWGVPRQADVDLIPFKLVAFGGVAFRAEGFKEGLFWEKEFIIYI